MKYDDLFDDYHLDFDLPDTNYDLPSYDIDSILDTDISDSLFVPETEIELDTFDNYSPGSLRVNNNINNNNFNNSSSIPDDFNYEIYQSENPDDTCQIIYRSRSDSSFSDGSSLSDYSSSYSASLSSTQSSSSDNSDSSLSSIIITTLLILVLLLQISRRGGKMYA